MSRPYREVEAMAHYYCPPDEGAVMARTTQRQPAVSRYSGRLRSMYGIPPTPFADDVMVSLYRLHRFDDARKTVHNRGTALHGL